MKTDWEYVQNDILTQQAHSVFTRKGIAGLETHITIANICKYSKALNKIDAVAGAVQRLKIGIKGQVFPIPADFDHSNQVEMTMLIKTFNLVNKQFDPQGLKNIELDRLQITVLQNGQIKVLKEVKF